MMILWLATALLTQEDYLGLPEFDPRASWKTIETSHFYIHYEDDIEPIAERAGKIFEEAHEKLTAKFQSSPRDKVHVVLSDSSDNSNGLSTPLPYNSVYLFIAPPAEFGPLDYYDDWLRMLIFHEYTHTIHLDQAEGINRFLRSIFGRFIIPNAAQQQWAHEGLAMLNETTETTKGRGRSPFTDMVIRTAILEGRFLPIHRATYWHDRYPFGNAAYLYGIKFYQYLVEKYGEKTVFELTQETARWPIPAFLNFKTKSVFGKSFHRLWNEWKSELENRYAGVSLEASARRFLRSQERLEGWGAWSDDGQTFYAPLASLVDGRQIVAFDFSKGFEKPERRVIKSGAAPLRLHYFKNKLYYAKSATTDRYHQYSDIFEYDLAAKKEKRLTRGLRVSDPFVTEKGIFAIRIHQLQSSIVRLNVSDSEIDDPQQVETLYKAPSEAVVSDISVNNDRMLWSMRHSEGRWILQKNLGSDKVERLSSLDECMHPSFASAREILVSCVEERAVGKATGPISSLQIFNLTSNTRHILTNPLTGDDLGVKGPKYWAYGRFSSEGYKLEFQESLEVKRNETLKSSNVDLATLQSESPSSRYATKTTATLSKGDYNSHSALLPHYVFPFFFYTESDLALGAFSGSHDPLQRWLWFANAYYLSSPQRPGGSLSIAYKGLSPVTVFGTFASSISDLGNIIATASGTTITLLADRSYYEHNYFGALGTEWQPYNRNGRLPFKVSLMATYEKIDSLFDLPASLATGRRNITPSLPGNPTTYANVLMRPDAGHKVGASLTISGGMPGTQASDDISPAKGLKGSLTTDYAPVFKDNLDSLSTTASLRAYFEMWRDSFVAAKISGGAQWFDAPYQRTFRMGGAFGDSPFSAVNKRVYALRGLASSALRGEGIVHAQLEYRLALLKSLPGFGTAPVWLKDLSLGLFSDIGQTFRIRKNSINLAEAVTRSPPEPLSAKRWTQSAGLELRSPISLSYGPPLLFRLGYGQVLFLQGDWRGGDRMSETYVSLGSSF